MYFLNFQFLIIKDITLFLFFLCYFQSLFFNTKYFFKNQNTNSFIFYNLLLIISFYSIKSNFVRYFFNLCNKRKKKYKNTINRHMFNDILFLIFILIVYEEHFLLKYYIIFLIFISLFINIKLKFFSKQLNNHRNENIELSIENNSEGNNNIQLEIYPNQEIPVYNNSERNYNNNIELQRYPNPEIPVYNNENIYKYPSMILEENYGPEIGELSIEYSNEFIYK